MTASGGQAELILDVASTAGLELPPLSPGARAEVERVVGTLTGDGNPLDAWGNGDFATNFPHALQVLGADPDSDAVALCSDSFDDQPIGAPSRMLEYARLLATGAKASTKPFYFMTMRSGVFRRDQSDFLREHGIPLIGGTRQGLGAVDRLARWSEPLRPSRAIAASGGRVAALHAGGARPTIHEGDAKRLLATAGVPVVQERQVATLDEAKRRALFSEVQRIFATELPIIHFAAPRVYVALSTRILNATPSLLRHTSAPVTAFNVPA